MSTPSFSWKKIIRIFHKLSLTQQIAYIALIFLTLLFPILIASTNQQTRTRSRAEIPATPPETPPEITPTTTPSPTPTITTNFAAQIQANNSAVYAPPILPNDIFTFEAWVKTREFTSTSSLESRFLFVQGMQNSPIEVSLRLSGNATIYSGQAGRLHATIYDSTGQPVYLFVSGPVVTANVWHHIAMTRDGFNIRLFVDGNPVGSQSYNGPTAFISPPGLSIGAYSTSSPDTSSFLANNLLNGEIDEVRLSNNVRYLSNFTPSYPPITSDENTISLYRLDGNGQDASVNQNHAQIKGNVAFVDSTVPQPSPTPTPTETPTPTLTLTPTPTDTPIPTVTPLPTATPTSTPTPIPNHTPVIITTKLPNGKVGLKYQAFVFGSDQDRDDKLNMRFINLPQGLSKGTCTLYKYNEKTQRKLIRCEIRGTPQAVGNYNVIVVLTDDRGAIARKILPLKIIE